MHIRNMIYTVSEKNAPTFKEKKIIRIDLMSFGRNIQKTLE